MRMMSMILKMSLIMLKEIARQDASGRVKIENTPHRLDMNLSLSPS